MLAATTQPRPTRLRHGALIQTQRFLTLAEAARRIGCASVKMREILKQSGVEVACSGSGEPAQISPAVIEKIEVDRLDLMTTREAAFLLGIRRDRVPAAMRALGLAPDRRPAALLIPATTWPKGALRRSLAELAKGLPGQSPSATLLTFGDAAGRLVRLGLSWEHVCVRLVSGEAPAEAQDPRRRGLAGLLFRLKDIEGLVGQKLGLTITEAGVQLVINSELAHLLVRYRLLDVEATRRGRVVSQAAIDRFTATYVLPARLGLDIGQHRGWTAARLMAVGCLPVLGPAQGSRHLVFLRRDVMAVLETLR